MRVIWPFLAARTMMLPNSSSVVRRPWVVYKQLKRSASCICRRGTKHPRRDLYVFARESPGPRPAAVKLCEANLFGLSHTRMLKSPRAEDLYIADAREPAQFVLHLENGQIRQVQHVVSVVRRLQVHNHQQIR